MTWQTKQSKRSSSSSEASGTTTSTKIPADTSKLALKKVDTKEKYEGVVTEVYARYAEVACKELDFPVRISVLTSLNGEANRMNNAPFDVAQWFFPKDTIELFLSSNYTSDFYFAANVVYRKQHEKVKGIDDFGFIVNDITTSDAYVQTQKYGTIKFAYYALAVDKGSRRQTLDKLLKPGFTVKARLFKCVDESDACFVASVHLLDESTENIPSRIGRIKEIIDGGALVTQLGGGKSEEDPEVLLLTQFYDFADKRASHELGEALVGENVHYYAVKNFPDSKYPTLAVCCHLVAECDGRHKIAPGLMVKVAMVKQECEDRLNRKSASSGVTSASSLSGSSGSPSLRLMSDLAGAGDKRGNFSPPNHLWELNDDEFGVVMKSRSEEAIQCSPQRHGLTNLTQEEPGYHLLYEKLKSQQSTFEQPAEKQNERIVRTSSTLASCSPSCVSSAKLEAQHQLQHRAFVGNAAPVFHSDAVAVAASAQSNLRRMFSHLNNPMGDCHLNMAPASMFPPGFMPQPGPQLTDFGQMDAAAIASGQHAYGGLGSKIYDGGAAAARSNALLSGMLSYCAPDVNSTRNVLKQAPPAPVVEQRPKRNLLVENEKANIQEVVSPSKTEEPTHSKAAKDVSQEIALFLLKLESFWLMHGEMRSVFEKENKDFAETPVKLVQKLKVLGLI